MYRLKEGHINSQSLSRILVILVVSNIFLGTPRAMVEEGATAGWILLLFAGTVASIGLFILVKLLKKFPGKNLIEIAETLWGRPGAVFTALSFGILAVYTAIISLREFAETMLTTVLPRTPISVVTFFFVAAMLLGAYKGLEVIGRTSTLLLPFVIGGILAILFLAGNYISLNNLFPLLGAGLGELAYHAPGRSSIFIEIILVSLIVSNISDNENIPRATWKAFGVSLAVFIVVEIFYISIFRLAGSEKLYVPLFQMARIIYMGRFIQRIEAIFIFIWFFTGALKLTLALYAGATALSRGFRIPIYQPLLFPLGLLTFSLSFVPPDIMTAVRVDMSYLREYGAVPAWGLPLALLATSFIRKKGGGRPEKNQPD